MLAFYLLRANRFVEFSSVAGIAAYCECYESLIVFKPPSSLSKIKVCPFHECCGLSSPVIGNRFFAIT